MGKHLSIQCKLIVGAPGDSCEKEADAVADNIMRMPEHNFLQRKCSCGEEKLQHQEEDEKEIIQAKFQSPGSFIQRKCTECAKKDEEEAIQRQPLSSFLQRKESSKGTIASEGTGNRINNSRGNGNNIDRTTRSFMENGFGADFGEVKIHTGNEAIQMNRELDAKAFTVGSDIYFNDGQYQPGSDSGKHLLAHELTHTIQQRNHHHVQRAPQKVSLNYSTACPDPAKIAESIPGALSMTDTACNWFISLNQNDQTRVAYLLRQIFLDDSDQVSSQVLTRLLSIRRYLEMAKDGQLFFSCTKGADPDCNGWNAYVRPGERNTIHICLPFYKLTLEERRWTLIHECSHVAGVSLKNEPYYSDFGTVDCTGSVSGTTSDALKTADNYAKIVWCLTRASNVVLRNP